MKTMFRSSFVLAFLFLALGARADGGFQFTYQGRVFSGGTAFTGVGQFKLALVTKASSETLALWYNSGDLALTEPDQAVSLAVNDGLCQAQVGDATLDHMAAIDPAIFIGDAPIYLRVWFSDGTNGFAQLTPDRLLPDSVVRSGPFITHPLDVYVNGSTGNDAWPGLSPEHPKKTINAAISWLPPRWADPVTIHVAPGVYRETVRIHNVVGDAPNGLALIGDETWTLAGGGSPSIRITGTDDDLTHVKVRNAIDVQMSSNVLIRGFLVDWSVVGLNASHSNLQIQNCKFTDSGYGVKTYFTLETISGVEAARCSADGICAVESNIDLANGIKCHDGGTGLRVARASHANISETGEFYNCSSSGIVVEEQGGLWFSDWNPGSYTGSIHNNGRGLWVQTQGYTQNHTRNAFFNNGQDVVLQNGGALY